MSFYDVVCKVCLIIMSFSFLQSVYSSDDLETIAQLDSEKIWQELIYPKVYPSSKIIEGNEQGLITLKLPERAEDASLVPISIQISSVQSRERYVEEIRLFIDRNPVPLVGLFELSPKSGRADISTRIRIDKPTYVRAVAKLNTGELYMAKGFVEAAGACSEPLSDNLKEAIANSGKMKIKVIGFIEKGKPILVDLKVKHPNISGMQPLTSSSKTLPSPHYLSGFQAEYNNKVIINATLTTSVSMNPVFRFYFIPEEEGTITVQAEDSKKNYFIETFDVTIIEPAF